MSIFFCREFYSKAVSLLLALAFLAESTLAPILLFLPQTARAAGSWGISIDSGKAGTFPNPVIRGKQVDFVATLTVTAPPSPLNFKLEASKDLTLRHYYIQRTGGEESALSDPTRPMATLANRNAYVWDFYNLTTGTYTIRFNFDVPLSTTDASAQFDIFMTALHSGYGSGYQNQSFPVPFGSFSSDFTGGSHVPQGSPLAISFAGAAPNAPVYVNCIDPNGVMCADNLADGITNASGQWSKSYDTTGWTLGTYRGWIVVSGLKSNLFVFTVTAPAAVPASMAIYRSPATSQTNPYKAGDATVSSSVNSPSLFATDYAGTGYNQIGSNPVRTFPFSTRDLVNSGACNASTGTCSIPGNWSATDFVCPAGVTGVQQMKEWYTIGNTTSNTLTWYFQCSVTTPTSSYTPIGSLDGIDTSGTATGWAVDPDSSATSISAHFYIDGAAGAGGTYAGSAVASLASSVANSAGYSGSHGYSFSIPQQWRDGKPHTLYVHGIDLSGDGSKNVLLSGVPKSFTLGTPPDSIEPTLFVSPAILSAGSQLTISVADAAANGTVKVFCRDPNNVVCDDSVSYTTNASGQFTHTYDTTGWTAGAYRGWVTANGVQSNTVNFVVTTSTTVSIPETTLSSYDFAEGTPFTVYVSGVPGGNVSTFCIDPNGTQCQDTNAGTTDASGEFSKSYDTTGWTTGSYTGWATVDGVKSNIASYIVRAATTTPPVEPPSDGRQAPTPTTAPMATLTLEREQEQVLPDQPVSFSGTLDSTQVLFPQGSTFFIAFPEKTSIERVEIDGKALMNGEVTVTGDSAKIPFPQNLYSGSHAFRIVLRNQVASVSQLDRRVGVWVSVIGADNKLLLKGRTASTLIAHLPTEVIGKGVSLAVPRTVSGWSSSGNCCWSSAGFPLLESGASAVPGSTYVIYDKKTYFPIREFGFSETDITRGPFFTPNQIPLLPENIAFTLFPNDASMQRVGMSLKQFSDPLAKEFITAQYQYIFGRDPSNEELSRYLPKFTGWRNPLANLMEVYNRRADVRQAIMVPRARNIGGSNDGSPRQSWDKLLEWVAAYGWSEEPSLVSFKPQTGFDDGWQLFQELWTKHAPLVYGENYMDYLLADAAEAKKNPMSAIAYLCYNSNLNHKNSQQDRKTSIDFEFCWKNDPLVRHTAILWAKDAGWAYNQIFKEDYADGEHGGYFMGFSTITINPDGPILASMFGPGKYPEFAEESAMRYPPAQLYYDLISSPEYASSIQQRFRTNIDSIYRLFFSRPATESDIAWVKNKFLGGIASYEFSDSKVFGFDRRWSWINDLWEPNGGLIASNFDYIEDEEFLKNSRFITDDVYGIRHIPGEIDTVSSRLIETIERQRKQELYQGDNFKRIVTGLYRLYLRRNPTDAEIESRRASGKDFGDIEFSLNQSSEYGEGSAPTAAIRNMYRNYLGRDPSDADIASWTGKSISTVANALGKSAEVRAYAQQHPENAYIFPIKEIKIKKCGFFCSVLGKIIGIAIAVVASYFGMPWVALGFTGAGGIGAAVGAAAVASLTASFNVTQRVIGSLSKGFSESGFNGKTFVSHVSIARAMAGQAGGVFNMANILENADPTILDGFRTMARAPQAPQGNAFAQAIQQTYPGLASPFAAIAGLFGAKQEVSTGRIAQIDVSSHYGSGAVAPSKGTSSAKGPAGTATAKASFTKMLAQGSRGAEVLKLQKLLGETDLTFLPEYQTGYYGAKTIAAVKRFQKRNGLEQVGFVGQKTRALLNTWGK